MERIIKNINHTKIFRPADAGPSPSPAWWSQAHSCSDLSSETSCFRINRSRDEMADSTNEEIVAGCQGTDGCEC